MPVDTLCFEKITNKHSSLFSQPHFYLCVFIYILGDFSKQLSHGRISCVLLVYPTELPWLFKTRTYQHSRVAYQALHHKKTKTTDYKHLGCACKDVAIATDNTTYTCPIKVHILTSLDYCLLS